MQLFKGKFYICEGLDTRNITNKSDCMQAGYRWIRRKYNFDNLGQVRRGSRCINMLTQNFHGLGKTHSIFKDKSQKYYVKFYKNDIAPDSMNHEIGIE